MRVLLALALAALAAGPLAAQITLTEASCQTNGQYSEGPPAPTRPNGHIAWPAENPVWEFDFYRPGNRTTVNSSGLELRDVRYRGRLVFARASVPVLNVEYDQVEGGCGCFRDWQTVEAPAEVGDGATLTLPCLAQADAGDVRTACEANGPGNPNPGGDVGSFEGVTVEDYGTELVLTGHTKAGWYRYRMKWHLYADGRIWPEFSFAAASAVCTDAAHRHHAYWRFDFDLDGTSDNDVVREIRGEDSQVFTAETSRVLGGVSDPTQWSVTDAASGIGYRIEPSEADRRLPVDAFSKTDALVLRYQVDEIDDGVVIGGGCAFEFEPFLDGEAIEGEDTVFSYRSGALHTAGSPFECDIAGPMLRPFGFPSTVVPGPEGVEFEPARPNPFSTTTTVRFRVDRPGPVTVELYDAAGRRVGFLYDGDAAPAAWQTVEVDGSTLPAGTYVVRVRGASVSGTSRVVLVR